MKYLCLGKNEIENLKKIWFKEKEMVNKISSAAKYGGRNVKISKYIILSFLEKGYFVKIDYNNFLLFEKEEDYLNLLYLERMISDLINDIKFEREEKEIKVSVRLALITKFIEKTNKIMLGSFYEKYENKNVYEIKFPYLWKIKKFRSLNKPENNILDYLNKWEDLDEMQDSLASEENNINSQGNKYSGYQEDDYGSVYIERLREIGYEMEALSLESKRRYEILRDKFFDMNRKIKKLIYIKRFKVKLNPDYDSDLGFDLVTGLGWDPR